MGDQAGGNARFTGPGSLWKTSWKGKVAFSELCCFAGFDRAVNWYEDPGGALDITPADGQWINLIASIDAPVPDTVEGCLNWPAMVKEPVPKLKSVSLALDR